MIYKVVEEYPESAFVVRFKLAEMQILPDLITRLTVVYCRDTVSCPAVHATDDEYTNISLLIQVEFLNGIFYTNSTWFLAQSVNSGQYFVKMKNRIIESIESNVQVSCDTGVLLVYRAIYIVLT